jgi:hypothetical protein
MSRLVSMVLSAALAIGVAGCCGSKPEEIVVEPINIDATAPTATLNYNKDVSDGKMRLTAVCDDSSARTSIEHPRVRYGKITEDVTGKLEESHGLWKYYLRADVGGDEHIFRSYSEENYRDVETLVLSIDLESSGYQNFRFSCTDRWANESNLAHLSLYLYGDVAVDASIVSEDVTSPYVQFEVEKGDDGFLVWDKLVVGDNDSGIKSVLVYKKSIETGEVIDIYLEEDYLDRRLEVDLIDRLSPIDFADGERGEIVIKYKDYGRLISEKEKRLYSTEPEDTQHPMIWIGDYGIVDGKVNFGGFSVTDDGSGIKNVHITRESSDEYSEIFSREFLYGTLEVDLADDELNISADGAVYNLWVEDHEGNPSWIELYPASWDEQIHLGDDDDDSSL